MKKKLTSVLVLCAMAFTLALPVSAAQPVSEGIQPRAQECGICRKMTLRIVTVGSHETGPTITKCKHNFPYGDDKVYKIKNTYQYKCSTCLYKSETWEKSSTRTECFGHY